MGTLQPLRDVAVKIQQFNAANKTDILFHSDGAQVRLRCRLYGVFHSEFRCIPLYSLVFPLSLLPSHYPHLSHRYLSLPPSHHITPSLSPPVSPGSRSQSLGKVAIDVQSLGLDLLTIVGHKYGAPKGVAALYLKQGIRYLHRSISIWVGNGGTRNGEKGDIKTRL